MIASSFTNPILDAARVGVRMYSSDEFAEDGFQPIEGITDVLECIEAGCWNIFSDSIPDAELVLRRVLAVHHS